MSVFECIEKCFYSGRLYIPGERATFPGLSIPHFELIMPDPQPKKRGRRKRDGDSDTDLSDGA